MIELGEAEDFIYTCVIGNIKKEELDLQRNNEINSLDMMQNTSIVYNIQCVIELQVSILSGILLLTHIMEHLITDNNVNKEKDFDNNLSRHNILPTEHFLIGLLVLHIL